jgi:predicted O-linked N-acetylglucosamine transferase (SPINDLY family)
MSSEVTRLAMARLAPVQATTHGHPVTSGVPAVDYYISWGAAELPTAQEHYSEQLMLLNDTVLHQYYQERHNGTHSRVNGGNFQELKKRQTFNSIPPGGHWYTCMQKPHKLMPEMDPLICGILEKDPEGRVILHHPSTQSMLRSLKKRLKAAGCKLSRVHFLPEQPHHALLALYALSTVVLDSYPAGGCTTTREALEMGAPVVTLPGRLLGGRWTYAYYKMLGDEKLMNQVVASTPAEYITKAVELGVNTAARAQVQARINMRLHKLYRKQEAVDSWERVLLQIAPVELQEKCT